MFSSFRELREDVEASDGVKTYSMRDLRDTHGAERLGVHVRDAIVRELEREGLSFVPDSRWERVRELPDDQQYFVRVYQKGTPTARLMDALRIPSKENDDVIRRAVANDDVRTLDKIRELICA